MLSAGNGERPEAVPEAARAGAGGAAAPAHGAAGGLARLAQQALVGDAAERAALGSEVGASGAARSTSTAEGRVDLDRGLASPAEGEATVQLLGGHVRSHGQGRESTWQVLGGGRGSGRAPALTPAAGALCSAARQH